LILASASTGRSSVLRNAGIEFLQITSGVDEDAIKREAEQENLSPEDIAVQLAVAKAQAVSQENPDAFVIGADQVLQCEGKLFDKPRNVEEAFSHLKIFQGATHQLISSVALVFAGETRWVHTETATLTMRSLSDPTLERYLDASGPEVLESVGVYRLEGIGATLFERIDGDYFTILGLPLLPLLACLRDQKIIPD
jgi:septum formation protein